MVAQNFGWYDRPMRWAQVAFVEDDPGRYSLDFVSGEDFVAECRKLG